MVVNTVRSILQKSRLPIFALVVVLMSVGLNSVLMASEVSDPTHNNASSTLEDPLAFSPDLAIFTGAVFALMMAILYAVAWKPIKAGLAAREEGISNQIADAKKASEEAQRKLVEYQAKLDAAGVQASEMIAQARKDAEAAGQRIVAEAQAEAARQKDKALAEIQSAKVAALSELGAKSTDLAFSLARGVLGREVKTADHQQLIQDALKSLPSRN